MRSTRAALVALAGLALGAAAVAPPVRSAPARPAARFTSAAQAWRAQVGPESGLVAGALASAKAPTSAAWQFRPIGPRRTKSFIDPYYQGLGPVSGRVASIAPVPGHPREAYLGAGSGGVWRTRDDGQHWTPVGDGLPVLTVGAVAVDPRHRGRVWVGTGESNIFNTAAGLGAFRSDDSGRTWHATSTGTPMAGCATSDLVVTGSSVLVSVVQGYTVDVDSCTDQSEGVWRSADAGRSWQHVVSGRVHDLRVSGRTVYATGGTGVGVSRSADGGASWSAVPGIGLPPAPLVARSLIDVAPDDPQRLVLLAAAATEDAAGLFTSTDGGTTWQREVSTQQPCTYSQDYTDAGSGQCLYDMSLLAEPKGSALVGGIVLQRWRDGVVDTLGFGPKGVHVDQHVLARDSAGRVWVGNDGGVYRTADGGRTFSNLNAELQITQHTHGVGVLPGGGFLGGSQDNGTLLRTSDGTWGLVRGGDGGQVVARPRWPLLLLSTYQNLGIQRSRDGGLTWKDATTGIVPSEPRAFYAPIVGDSGAEQVLWAATNRVYRTADAGDLWVPASPVLGSSVGAMAVARKGEAVSVYAAANGIVWACHDGLTWTPSTVRMPAGITSLVTHPRDPRHVWATVGSTGAGHLFESADGGATFTDVGKGLPDLPAFAALVDPASGRVFVGTYGGLYVRDGGRWVRLSRGLPAVPVTDLVVSPEGQLVVSTYGRGVFTAPLKRGT